ncbi:sex hormone-binding globulin isoform X3 [Alligator mississippiensis]|uniref:sex hormone-binding globulin isoform X3 n=1 Tax=Alligator mississippiensis TaxID=8496 RepID=UPI002877EC00|nr:sex hormone-binding globulin isoform X3 [Alligator mississippiensis]
MALPATLLLLLLPLPVAGDPSQDALLFQAPQGDPEAVNLGVRWGSLTPTGVIHIDLSTVTSATSSFEFRTRDAEGPIFSGDTGGGDWFVLGLRRGQLEVQLQNSVTNLSAAAGPRLDDGRWHRLSVSSEGHAVLLELDGAPALTLRHVAAPLARHPLPTMRIAPGGLLWPPTRLLDPLDPAMDGCMRRWDWLNQTVAWGQGSSGGPPKPCFRTLLPGSFFAGGGAIFTTAGPDIAPGPGGAAEPASAPGLPLPSGCCGAARRASQPQPAPRGPAHLHPPCCTCLAPPHCLDQPPRPPAPWGPARGSRRAGPFPGLPAWAAGAGPRA